MDLPHDERDRSWPSAGARALPALRYFSIIARHGTGVCALLWFITTLV